MSSSSTTTDYESEDNADTPEGISDDHDMSGEDEGEDMDVEEVDNEEGEDDDCVDVALSRIKIPSGIRVRGIVNVPKLIVYDKLIFDCPYLVSCHVLSSILSTLRIIGLTSPEELRESAIQTISVEGYTDKHYPQINKDSLNKHIDNILQVDPRMYCWTNFHISYLYSHWIVIGRNKVNSLDKNQRKLRLRAWYYVIIFLCRQITKHPEILTSSYLLSVINCILNISEIKIFAKLMTDQRLDEPEGIDTEHWLNLQVYITSYSRDDNDPSGDDWNSSLQLLYDAGKVKQPPSLKKPSLKQPSLKLPSVHVKRNKEEVKDLRTDTTKIGKLPPLDNLLQIYLFNSMQSQYGILQQFVLDEIEYVNKLLDYQDKLRRKRIAITNMAERVVAAQDNLTDLFYNQVHVAKLSSQQAVLDAHHEFIADRSDVTSLLALVRQLMQPLKCGRVLPDEQPNPGNFPPLEELAPSCSLPEVKSSLPVEDKSKHSESFVLSPVGTPITGLMSTGQVLEELDLTGSAHDGVSDVNS